MLCIFILVPYTTNKFYIKLHFIALFTGYPFQYIAKHSSLLHMMILLSLAISVILNNQTNIQFVFAQFIQSISFTFD